VRDLQQKEVSKRFSRNRQTLRWICAVAAVAAVVVRWKIFSSHRRGWCVVCLLFFDSYEERKERVRWLRWYLGNVSHAWQKFIWRGTPDRWVGKIFQPIGGETSGFTTASTAKAMNALSGKGLACGGYPPQGTAVFTAPPQKKRTPESVLDDLVRWRGVRDWQS
jgi:hypothetical protein